MGAPRRAIWKAHGRSAPTCPSSMSRVSFYPKPFVYAAAAAIQGPHRCCRPPACCAGAPVPNCPTKCTQSVKRKGEGIAAAREQKENPRPADWDDPPRNPNPNLFLFRFHSNSSRVSGTCDPEFTDHPARAVLPNHRPCCAPQPWHGRPTPVTE